MALREHVDDIDDRLSESDTLYRLKQVLDRLLPLVLLLLIAALYYEFFVPLPPAQHHRLVTVEQLIVGYFVLELLVDLGLYRSNRKFLQDRWVDIILVLPLAASVRAAARVGRAVAGLKSVKLAKVAKVVKAGKLKHIARGKYTRGVRHTAKAVKKSVEGVFETD